VQHQIGRVLMIARVRAPLPRGKVGVTFAHVFYSSIHVELMVEE
jgi:hypothetical protein